MRLVVLFFLLIPWISQASTDSVSIPLDENRSAPSIDLIHEGKPLDRDLLWEWIRQGRIESSALEPQLSRIYRGETLPILSDSSGPWPQNSVGSPDSVVFKGLIPGTSGLVRARVSRSTDPSLSYELDFSLDSHAALARNALLRKLGYAIPTPRHYRELKVDFESAAARDQFLDRLSSDTLTSRSRWIARDSGSNTSVIFQDLVLEPALIEVPRFHWGILTPEVLNSRRSLRALIVPLSLLDLPESVNLYAFDPAKIFNESLIFSRPGAAAFQNETTIGDVRWIARRMASFTLADWAEIIAAGKYPEDLSALILEKTLGRVNRLMSLLSIREFTPFTYDPEISIGSVVRGKATQELYPGYALRFTYGDPLNPLRTSELARFFGVSAINSALSALLDKANTYLQVLTPQDQIDRHRENALQEILSHFQEHPNEPFVQPLEIWGGPIGGANLNASRNIVTGTYYGSDSQIQLVDSVSASVNVGGFFGLSGVLKVGVSAAPALQASRSYVHVRPLPDLKTAWKENWAHVFVPGFMIHLSKVLNGSSESDSIAAVKAFMDSLKPGELLIVTDSVAASAGISAQIPLGALIGFLPTFGSLGSSVGINGHYGVLARTTVMRSKDGLQVYLQRADTGSVEFALDSRFLVKLIELAQSGYRGRGETEAFLFPEKLEQESQARLLQRDLRTLLVRNHAENLREDFRPFLLDHKTSGNRFRLGFGPFTWVRRHTLHRVEVTPPVDPDHRYEPEAHKRTVVEGQLTRILGSDPWGFLGGIARAIEPLLNLSSPAKGDDPSANFLGRSRTFLVSTQIETTPGRNPGPFMKLERAFTGWSLRKKRLLKLIRKISEQVNGFEPSATLINPDEFTQTRKIQAYRLSWNLLIYPKGIQRLLGALDVRETGTLQIQQQLIQLMAERQGAHAYENYCKEHGRNPMPARGPLGVSRSTLPSWSVLESSRGQITYLDCVTPLMMEIYELRSWLAQRPLVFLDANDEASAKDRIRLLNRVASRLSMQAEIGDFIALVGKENSFFQARVSGYRTRDENGDSDYFSNTIGLVDQELLAGPLSDIADSSTLSINEIEARYLSNGY